MFEQRTVVFHFAMKLQVSSLEGARWPEWPTRSGGRADERTISLRCGEAWDEGLIFSVMDEITLKNYDKSYS